MMELEKREKKTKKLSAEITASSSKTQKSEKMVPKEDIELVTIDSDDEEEKKVE